MLINNTSGSIFDPSYSNTLFPTGGDFFAYKDLIVLEKLNSDKKQNIEHFFDLQIGNYKS